MNNSQMLQRELSELEKLELALMIKRMPEDPWVFMTGFSLGKRWSPGESNGSVWTIDEHDPVPC